MLIIRTGGPLSSVADHCDNGLRRLLYYRPPNEAILIFTPAPSQIEICGDGPKLRQDLADCFAHSVLGQDVSGKPLTWKRYDLSRIRCSLNLPLPDLDGVSLLLAKVVEIELRLGTWTRKLALKVGVDDDIEEVVQHYLGTGSIVSRAETYSKISIAVRYRPDGEKKIKYFSISISGSKSCNLQSMKDETSRNVGYALLRHWGILATFKQLSRLELDAALPTLLELFNHPEGTVSGTYLQEAGLDPRRLVEGGLTERRERQEIVLIDGGEGEASVSPSRSVSSVELEGPFGEALGRAAMEAFDIYRLNDEWLRETLIGAVKPLLTQHTLEVCDDCLTLVGATEIDGASVPVYLARRLADPKVAGRLDTCLRGRSGLGFGLVLSAGATEAKFLGPNVVTPVSSLLARTGCDRRISRDDFVLAFRGGRLGAKGAETPTLLRQGPQSATLILPGKDPLYLHAANQILVFDRLVRATLSGNPELRAGELIDETNCNSPQQCFRGPMWKSIFGVYIMKGANGRNWRLAT